MGGLPEDIAFDLVEPVKFLYKDEVRELGEAIGLPRELVWRQPFPGPGLGVRVVGAITPEKVRMVRESDQIFRDEIAAAGLDHSIWQYFTVCPGCRSVGVTDGVRTYGEAIVLRAVQSHDAMSADVAELSPELLRRVTLRICAGPPRESFVEDVHALMGEEHWVTEWQYSSVRAVLASQADLMVWLDLPVATVMRQVTMRTLRRRLRREVLWNGNREPALWTVATEPDHIVRWAWKTRRRTAERIVVLMNERPDLPVVRLTSHREARAWVAGPLAASSPGGMAYQREGA